MRKHILLIDNDSDEFEFFTAALNKIPGLFTCSFAQSAEEALQIAGKKKPDYIFVDMNMPMADGLECLSRLKVSRTITKIPLFIYTTCHDQALSKKAIGIGATGCLRKPSVPQDLAMMLHELHKTNTVSQLRE